MRRWLSGAHTAARTDLKAGIVKANIDADMTKEASLRTFGSVQAQFAHPSTDADRKAQSIFLALSLLGPAAARQTQPLRISLL